MLELLGRFELPTSSLPIIDQFIIACYNLLYLNLCTHCGATVSGFPLIVACYSLLCLYLNPFSLLLNPLLNPFGECCRVDLILAKCSTGKSPRRSKQIAMCPRPHEVENQVPLHHFIDKQPVRGYVTLPTAAIIAAQSVIPIFRGKGLTLCQ